MATGIHPWNTLFSFLKKKKLKTSDDTVNEMLLELKQYGTSAGRGCILSSNYDSHKIAFRLDIMLRFVTGKLRRENLRAVPGWDSSAQVTRREVMQDQLAGLLEELPWKQGTLSH